MVDPTGKRERISLRRRLRLIQGDENHQLCSDFASRGRTSFGERCNYGVRYTTKWVGLVTVRRWADHKVRGRLTYKQED